MIGVAQPADRGLSFAKVRCCLDPDKRRVNIHAHHMRARPSPHRVSAFGTTTGHGGPMTGKTAGLIPSLRGQPGA